MCFSFCKEKIKTSAVVKIRVDSIEQTIFMKEEKKVTAVAKIVKTDSSSNDSINVTVEENLYGTFFGDRAEFFIVNDPKNLIHGAKIKKVTFCYLDGELCQSRYVLETDISDKLIRTHGNFKIKGFDFKDRRVIADQNVMIDYGKGMELNHDLHNFELTWTLGDRHIKMRVNRHAVDQPFEYTEQLADYNLLFRSIEYAN